MNNGGTAQPNALRHVALSGTTHLGGSSDWDIRFNGTGALLGNNHSLFKTGTNGIWLADLGNSSLGNITIIQGVLGVEGSTTLGTAVAGLTVDAGATFGIRDTGTNALDKIGVLNGGRLLNESGTNTFSGSIGVNGAGVVEVQAGTSLEVSGLLTGTGALEKTGPGTLTLSAANTFDGPIGLSGGTLLLTHSGSVNNSPLLDVGAGATLDVTSKPGGYNVPVNQTLGGSGTVAGDAIVNGTVSPGSSIARLTFTGGLTLGGSALIELSKVGATLTNDVVAVAGPLTLGGTLNVVHAGDPLTDGDNFQLFAAGGHAGSFAALNLPSLTSGLTWRTDQLPIDGTLSVIPVPAPEILPVQLDGTNLVLSLESADGVSYVLESSTTFQPPVSWTPMATNIGTGSLLEIPIPVNPGATQQFFRIRAN